MLNKRHLIPLFFTLAIEYVFIYVAAVPFNYSDHHNPWGLAGPLALLMLTTFALYYLVHLKIKQLKAVLFLFIALIILGLGYILGLTFFAAFVMSILLFWRMLEVLEGNTQEHMWKFFIATMGLGLVYDFILKFYIPSFPYRFLFILLFILQLLLVIALNLFARSEKKGNILLSSSYGLVLGGTLITGLIIAWIGPYVGWAISWVLKGIGFVVFVAVEGFITFLMSLKGHNEGQLVDDSDLKHGKEQAETWAQMTGNHSYAGLVIGVGVVVLVIFVVFLYMRKKRLNLNAFVLSSTDVAISPIGQKPSASVNHNTKKRFKAPKDPVRAQVFQLQKKLLKGDLGRVANETLSEWLSRLPASDKDKHLIRSVYEKARYGSAVITGQELLKYREAIERVRALSQTNEEQK
ncbi:hypothetical protein JOD43_001791 [Pullulanibacillus pueri]|uniref:DUF4129 domain-containing protein n=1 Tax=Pullulanibacillus pueri TaxID=1437324 RepID=A0A8J3EL27_9BACL|nr:hypothetical protein [Pullulanibacillus pueri]MBM7681624.1 hypothetical protein [Pullulanibacillus pueri]GGH79410.1 hypothetical protein GCM10007096_14290 [Pullulanibacillus pueri]